MPRHMAATDGSELPPFYQHLRDGFTALGARVAVVHRDMDALQTGPTGPDFNFVHNGRIARAGLLNIGLAYMYPFWYVDPKGVFADSSLTDLAFDPAQTPQKPAARMFARLQARLKDTRISRYAQPEEVAQFPTGAIAVFLQDWSDPVERARHMTARDMLETVIANAGGRSVIVKPHPRVSGLETFEILDWLARDHPQIIARRRMCMTFWPRLSCRCPSPRRCRLKVWSTAYPRLFLVAPIFTTAPKLCKRPLRFRRHWTAP